MSKYFNKMLDYYGSIVKSEQEIDRELIKKFRDRCYESYMKQIISDLKKENILNKEYSHSGWMVFHSKSIYDNIRIRINNDLNRNNKRIKFLYCYNQSYKDTDVCKMICDKI